MLEYPNFLLMLLNIILFKCFTDWRVVYRNCEIKTNLSPADQLFRSLPTNFFFPVGLYSVIHDSSLFSNILHITVCPL